MPGGIVRVIGRLCLLGLLVAAPPPGWAQGTGVIEGTVRDGRSTAPIVDAGVEAVGTGQSVRTGPSGSFTLRVPEGTNEIRVVAPFYRTETRSGVAVSAGGTTRLDVALEPSGAAEVEVLEIVAEAGGDSESNQLMRRLQAPMVAETISAEIIRKLPGSDAASVAKRVPSVTVQSTEDGEKILCVRGLCNRYTIGLVDGMLLPSTNPIKRLVPAEIFPAEFLGSLAVYKTFLPNLRGNFQGAQVEFELAEPPEELTYSLSTSVGGNTQTTGQEFATYEGSDLDGLGLGKDFRSPPASLPDDLSSVSDARRFRVARSFENIWDVDTETAGPNTGGKFSIGNTVGPLGFLLAGLYGNEYHTRTELTRTLRNEAQSDVGTPDIAPRDVFPDSQRSRFNTRLGGFLSTKLTLSDEHAISLRSFINRRSQDEVTQQLAGPGNGGLVNGNDQITQRQWRLKYLEDEVAFGMLSGDHLFPWVEVEWRGAMSRSTRDEPDTRHVTYQGIPPDVLRFQEDSLGGLRINNETTERLYDAALDVTLPFQTWLPFTDVWTGLDANVQTGFAYTQRDRDFDQRRFRFAPDPASQDTSKDPEILFAPNNIGPGAADVNETTLPTDAYHATEEVYAYYGMTEIPIVQDRLRVVGGVRVEDATITLDTQTFRTDDLCRGNESICPLEVRREHTDVLPGVSLIYSPRSDMNFRLGYGQTVSRPEFRELAPTQFPAQRGERPSFGNIELIQSEWTNYDARWEWLSGDDELVSLSAFYKEGENPIERTEINLASDVGQTWINASETKLLGFEAEARKNLGFLGPYAGGLDLDGFSFSTNATWFPSKKTTVPQDDVSGLSTLQTNAERDAVSVPDFIVNATLEYELPDVFTARILYQTVGRELDFSGSNGVPDAFSERRDQLDVVLQVPLERWIGKPVKMQFAVENILNDQEITSQGPFTIKRYTDGVFAGMSLTYTY
jgi:TonB-dependent receptor